MKLKDKPISLSRKAKKKIIEFIREQKLQPDDILPSETTLMEMLGVSRYTVREALALLEQDRIVYKIQGKGTFVNKTPIQIESGLEKLESVTEIIKSFGYEPGTIWVSIEENYPTKDMVEKLKITENDKVVTFKRIRTANGKVAAYCVDTLSKSVLEDVVPKCIQNESMFSFLKENYGADVEYAISEIIPTLPTEEMINVLGIDENKLFLLLHQVHYDKEGNSSFYSMDYFNPEVFKFKVNRGK